MKITKSSTTKKTDAKPTPDAPHATAKGAVASGDARGKAHAGARRSAKTS